MTAKKTEGAGVLPPEKKPGLRLSDWNLQQDAERGARMVILEPTPEGLPTSASCQVIGRDAKTYRVAYQRISNLARIAIAEEGRDEADAKLYEYIVSAAAALVDWDGILDEHDDPIPFSAENALRYLFEYHWIADQIIGFTAARGNFRNA